MQALLDEEEGGDNGIPLDKQESMGKQETFAQHRSTETTRRRASGNLTMGLAVEDEPGKFETAKGEDIGMVWNTKSGAQKDTIKKRSSMVEVQRQGILGTTDEVVTRMETTIMKTVVN